MNEITPDDDWARAMQAGFSRDLARLDAAGELTAAERICLQQVLQEPPRDVYRLRVAAVDGPLAELAGYFLVTLTDSPLSGGFLYSPVAGLEKVARAGGLPVILKARLADPLLREDLLRFVPIEVREQLINASSLKLQRALIKTGVFENRYQSIIDLRLHNLELMRARLLDLPSLRNLLNHQLKLQLDHEFQGMDLSPLSMRVSSYAITPQGAAGALVTSMSLGDAALRYLADGLWPGQYIREYVSPTVPYVEAQARSPTLDVRMYTLVRQSTGPMLSDWVGQQVEAFWWVETEGLSLRALARHVMSDRFFNQLLQARHLGWIDQARFDGFKGLCLSQQPAGPGVTGQWQPLQLSLLEQDTAEVALAGMFNAYAPAGGNEMFLFSSRAGLERFASPAAVKADVLARLKDPRQLNNLLTHVSRDQQPVLRALHSVIVEAQVISDDLFANRVQSIIDKQLRDLKWLISTVKNSEFDVNAVVDHALDVRTMLDPRLMALSTQGRWSTGLALERETAPALSPIPDTQALRLIQSKLQTLGGQVNLMMFSRPDLRSVAQIRLKAELSAAGVGFLLPYQLQVQTYAHYALRKMREPLRVASLQDTLLERVTGANPLPTDGAYIRLGAQKNSPEIKPVDSLGGTKLLPLLDRAAQGLLDDYCQRLRMYYVSMAAGLSRLRGSALRYEVLIKRAGQQLMDIDIQMLTTVLDQPLRSQRHAINGFAPDICELSLLLPGRRQAVSLSNCFVLTERGGTDTHNSGRALLWTPVHGLEGYASLSDCLESLPVRLQARHWAFLDAFSLNERPVVLAAAQSPLLWVPTVIEEDWFVTCQRRVVEKNLSDIELIVQQGVASHRSAQGLIHQVARYWEEQAVFNLRGIECELRDWLFNEGLPDWLKHASPADRQDYAEIMLRFRQAGAGDYCEGVPQLLDYAREQLTVRLKADFPDAVLEPDKIEISVVQFSGPAGGEIAGPAAVSRLTRNLTHFALSNFFNLQSGLRSYRSLGPQPLPSGLDDHYVRELVRSLDLAARYRALLIEKLTPGHEGVAHRQVLFGQQLPAQMLEYALQSKLKGELGETAYGFLKHVFNSPDAKAREPFKGLELVIRPLAFRAIAGRHPDVVRGMYLIGTASLDAGPQILYVLYSKDYVLKEFADQKVFLNYLHQTPEFQALVLQRMVSRVRKIYAHNGFFEPHIGYVDPTLSSPVEANPPATLGTEVVSGNLLSRLYADTFELRLARARDQTRSVAQADWASLVYVLSLLADIALLILPGKLSVPLMVWQGEANVQAAVEAVAEERWGEALFDFANGLLMIEVARASVTPAAPPTLMALEPPAGRLTPEQHNGLRPYAANHVSLVDLIEDAATGFYTQALTGQHYIALDGQVFQVVAWQERWRIYIGDGRDGPLIRRDDQQRWALDLKEPLPGGGQALGRLSDAPLPAPSASGRTVTATGIDMIERLQPRKARVIREAHEQAVRYTRDCLAHLESVTEVSEFSQETRLFLARVFSVAAVEKTVIGKLKRAVDKILTTLQSPEYSPVSSARYALFSSPDQRSIAMTSKMGLLVKYKAVFLGDRYFARAADIFEHSVTGRDGLEFDRVKHSTATILIHEFSHVALNTIDINYLGVSHPFEELLVPEPMFQGPVGKLKRQMQDHRYRQLTTEIARGDLFKEKATNRRAYFAMDFRLEYVLLKRTHCQTIDQVRSRFFSDPAFRADVILMNADSLALLITWLGYFKPPDVATV